MVIPRPGWFSTVTGLDHAPGRLSDAASDLISAELPGLVPIVQAGSCACWVQDCQRIPHRLRDSCLRGARGRIRVANGIRATASTARIILVDYLHVVESDASIPESTTFTEAGLSGLVSLQRAIVISAIASGLARLFAA